MASKDPARRYEGGTTAATKQQAHRTVRVFIENEHVQEARALAAAGTVEIATWADVAETGLLLRVRGSSASWLVKRKGRTKMIASADRMFPKTARERARTAKELIDAGVDPGPFFAARAAGRSETQAREEALNAGQKKESPPGWTFDKLAHHYLDEHIAKGRISGNRRLPPSAETYKEVKRILWLPETQPIRNKLISEITRREAEEICNQVGNRYKPTTQLKFVVYLKAAYNVADKVAGTSGLENVAPWWNRLSTPILEERSRRRRPLLPDHIGRLLALAEHHKHLPGRKISSPPSELAVCALWWIVLTAQRRGAALRVRNSWIVDDPHQPGWGLIIFPQTEMKSRRIHSLPLPPQAMKIVERVRASRSKNSSYLFPASRRTKAGVDAPATTGIVTLFVQRLRGRDSIGRSRGLPDLLGDVPEFSPHNLRSAFATALRDLGVRGDAISAVLDHAMPETKQDLYEDAATITKIAYDQSQKLAIKREALARWSELVFTAYRQHEEALAENGKHG